LNADIFAKILIQQFIHSTHFFMKQFSFLFILLSVTYTSFAQKVWNMDKSHARIGFTVTHGMISEVDGNFKTFDAKVTTTKDDLSDAIFELTAETSSLNTDHEGRDKDLKGADFFDVATYPTLTFKSTSMTKILGNQYKVVGQLTMKGVTLPVSLDLWLTGPVKNDWAKKNVFGVKAIGKLNRTDYKVGAKLPVFVVGDEVALRFVGEFGAPLQ
jgi:polyisoprenoid-binding protein YceI